MTPGPYDASLCLASTMYALLKINFHFFFNYTFSFFKGVNISMTNTIYCSVYQTRERLKTKTTFIKTAALKFCQVSNEFDINKQISLQSKVIP